MPPASCRIFWPGRRKSRGVCSRVSTASRSVLIGCGRPRAAVARQLRQRGLQRGDRVAVMQRNSRTALPTLYGLARAGIVWVPVNAQLRGDGLRYVLEHCQPSLVIADDDMLPLVAESERRIIVRLHCHRRGRDMAVGRWRLRGNGAGAR